LKIKREKSTSTKGHYVRNSDLLPAVIEAKGLNRVTDKLIRMIQLVAERYSRKSNFIGYSFREDMVSAAVMNLCNNALKFNPEKSANPFSFYTTAIHNSFLQYMADEKKHRNIKDALLVDAGSNPSWNYHDGSTAEETAPKTSDDIMIKDTDRVEHDELHTSKDDPVDIKPARSRHPKWAAREPGPVVVYKPGEYTVDPETGKVTIIVKEEPAVVVPPPKKKKPAPKKAKKSPRKVK
jgi:hypothetical protein